MNRGIATLALATLIFSLALPPVMADQPKPLKVGKVTFHVKKFAGQDVLLVGYPLSLAPGTVYFSDEAAGKITVHDLAVSGAGLEVLQSGHKYVIAGKFVGPGAAASNGSLYHLELSAAPVEQK